MVENDIKYYLNLSNEPFKYDEYIRILEDLNEIYNDFSNNLKSQAKVYNIIKTTDGNVTLKLISNSNNIDLNLYPKYKIEFKVVDDVDEYLNKTFKNNVRKYDASDMKFIKDGGVIVKSTLKGLENILKVERDTPEEYYSLEEYNLDIFISEFDNLLDEIDISDFIIYSKQKKNFYVLENGNFRVHSLYSRSAVKYVTELIESVYDFIRITSCESVEEYLGRLIEPFEESENIFNERIQEMVDLKNKFMNLFFSEINEKYNNQ